MMSMLTKYTLSCENLDSKNIIAYMFPEYNPSIFTLDMFNTDDTYVLYFSEIQYPLFNYKDKIKNLIINGESIYLTKNKKIFIAKKTDIVVNEGIPKLIVEKYCNIFCEINDANPLKHIFYDDIYENHFIYAYKIYHKKYINIFNSDLPYKSFNLLNNKLLQKKKSYYAICFVNDYNYEDFIINLNYKYNHVRLCVICICKDLDKIINVHNKVKKYNGICINKFITLCDVILKHILWFEYVMIINEKFKINFEQFNKCHEHKNIMYHTKILSCIAKKFVILPVFNKSNECDLIDLPNQIKRFALKPYLEYDHFYDIYDLMNIRDYIIVKNIIDNEIIKNMDITKYCNLICKKISIYSLTDTNENINDDVAHITNATKDQNILLPLGMLILSQKNLQLKEYFCETVLRDACETNNISTFTLYIYNQYIYLKNISDSGMLCLLKYTKLIFDKDKLNNNTQQILNILSVHARSKMNNLEIQTHFYELMNLNCNIFDRIDILENSIKQNKCTYEYLYSTAVHFSPYFESCDDQLMLRQNIENNIDKLIQNLITNPKKYELSNICSLNVGNFYLSYQGISSKNIFIKKAKYFRTICPDLNYVINKDFTNQKINICFHSNFLGRHHSVYKDRHQVIKKLSEDDRFNVYFSTFDDLNIQIKFTFGRAKHIKLQYDHAYCKNILENLKLDILVFCEIGMCNFSYLLSFMKLAKIYINTWGHSDTSGVDTIDYFISSKLYELPYDEAQTHYSEKLILMDSLSTCYVNPLKKHMGTVFKDRYSYGFTYETNIYFCMQSTFKFSHMYDQYLIDILTKDPEGIILLSDNDFKSKILKRFNNKNISSRFHFMPTQQHHGYMNLMHISDVILDPYPFGGCNSSFEGFSLCKPIVTQPSNMINGRFTSGFYKKMNLYDLVTHNKDSYVNFALKLAKDKTYRQEISDKIKQNNNILFENEETIDEWKKCMIDFIDIHKHK